MPHHQPTTPTIAFPKMNRHPFARLLGLALLAAPCWLALPAPRAADPAAAHADLALARQLENAFVRVAEQASQSVVVIVGTRTMPAPSETDPHGAPGHQFEGTPFERFFRYHGFPQPEPRDIDSEGSGVILRADGYILTNNHVVDGADTLKVRLKDGRELPATVVGTDDRTDVAVLKVEAADLPAAVLGDSETVKPGQWAIAIGAPFQLDYSFTVGFVSATGRSAVWTRRGSAYEDYIQTDASINPGNSGGPLCDIEGRVIGINTLIRGLNRGIGFAIPINMARTIADQLIRHGEVVRPWIGIAIEALADNEDLARGLTDIEDGVVVRAIYPDTPAAASDLKPADVIVSVDDVTVKTPRDLQQQILGKQVGDVVALRVYRDGQPVTIRLATGKLPTAPQVAAHADPDRGATSSTWGVTVQSLTPDLAQRFGVTNQHGVVVTDITPGSLAEEKGLEVGDIITEVDRQAISNADEFRSALQKSNPEKGALLYYSREGSSAFVVLKAGS